MPGDRHRALALSVARLLERDAELRQLSGLARRVGRDPGRVVLMKPDGSLLTGLASDIITDATLSMIYGTDIGVFTVARRAGPGQLKFCSPWP